MSQDYILNVQEKPVTPSSSDEESPGGSIRMICWAAGGIASHRQAIDSKTLQWLESLQDKDALPFLGLLQAIRQHQDQLTFDFERGCLTRKVEQPETGAWYGVRIYQEGQPPRWLDAGPLSWFMDSEEKAQELADYVSQPHVPRGIRYVVERKED